MTAPPWFDAYWQAVTLFVASVIIVTAITSWLTGWPFGCALIIGGFAPLALMLVAYVLDRWERRRLRHSRTKLAGSAAGRP